MNTTLSHYIKQPRGRRRSGNEAPCAYGELISIGAIGGEKNKAISGAVAAVLKAKLNIDPARFYLKVCKFVNL